MSIPRITHRNFSASTMLGTATCTGESCCPMKGYGGREGHISCEAGIKNLSHFLLFRLLALKFHILVKMLWKTACVAMAQLLWLCLIQEGLDSYWSSYQRLCRYAQDVLQNSSFLLLAMTHVINSKKPGFEIRDSPHWLLLACEIWSILTTLAPCHIVDWIWCTVLPA